MIVVAFLIKVTDKGPVLYKQCRLTKNGKQFMVLKFRSMRVDAEKDGVARLSSGDKDDRITPIGKFIRKVRFDELPQLFNILFGDMSIVGPRPLLVQYLERYNEEQKHRHDVKPGLTGLAQVNGRNGITWEEKFHYDLEYVKNITFYGDCKIIFQTVMKVFGREGISSATSVTMEEFKGNK